MDEKQNIDDIPMESSEKDIIEPENGDFVSEDFSDDEIQDTEDADNAEEELTPNEPTPEAKEGMEASKKDGETAINKFFDFTELFVFTIAAVILLLSFVFRHSVVDGGSMMNTLHHGEHLIISDLFYTPERGDIIVFEDHSTGNNAPLIKRVIAIEGDTVEIVGQSVYVNGDRLIEDYVFIDYTYYQEPIKVLVPEGEVFVLGDHRNNSQDSRIFGTVDVDSILGKVIFRFFPFDSFGKV